MMQVWRRKFERNLQDYGWNAALSKTLAYFFRFVYEHANYRLYRIDLLKDQTEAPSPLGGAVFRIVDAADDSVIEQIENHAEWLKGTVKRRISHGALCLAAFDGDALAGFNLVSFGQVFMPLVRMSRTFREDEAWSEHIATLKAFRQKGLASQLRYRVFDELRKRGIRTFYGGALVANHPSLKLARRVGFQEFVEIRYTWFLSLKRWRYVRVRDESA